MPVRTSILMPVKNAGPFLRECLDSILKQTDRDWELLAVDDNSEDDSAAILHEYSQLDSRVYTLGNTGSGIIDALRLAYSKSRGQLITRMDADDIMSPDKIKVLSEALKESGPGHVAVGLVKYFSRDNLGQGYQRYAEWLNSLTREGENYRDIYKECVIPSPCWMMHREDLLAISAFEPDIYPEDYDLCFRMYQAGLKVKPVTSVLHHWRDHSDRASRNDDHYADNTFLELKVHYFLKLDHDRTHPLIVWGGGKKGKRVAKMLLQREIEFDWITKNQNKQGQNIYGKTLKDLNAIEENENAQIMVLVAPPDDQKNIRLRLQGRANEVFWFC